MRICRPATGLNENTYTTNLADPRHRAGVFLDTPHPDSNRPRLSHTQRIGCVRVPQSGAGVCRSVDTSHARSGGLGSFAILADGAVAKPERHDRSKQSLRFTAPQKLYSGLPVSAAL